MSSVFFGLIFIKYFISLSVQQRIIVRKTHNLHVIQYSNSIDLTKEYEEQIKSVWKWTIFYNYSYELIYGTEKDSYFQKIETINNHSVNIPRNDWVAFLDFDIKIWNLKNANISSLHLKNCNVVAQDSNRTVNTGFLLIRRNQRGKNFSKSWIDK